jgi:putative membrane protein
MKHTGLLAVACVAALCGGCSGNQRAEHENTIAPNNGAVGTAGAGISSSDKNFVNEMLSDGMAEVETAKLAQERAGSAEVKQFAQMMIDDHTSAGNSLKQVAMTYAIPQEPKIDDDHMRLMDKLRTLNGTDFDKEYMAAMVDGHEDVVKDLRSRVDEDRSLGDRVTGKNPEDRSSVKPETSDDKVKMSVNEWAANTLPTVEHHLDRAKQIKDHVEHPNRTARADTDYRSK